MSDEMETGWESHDGGGCPLHGNTQVAVRFRDGMEGVGAARLWWGGRSQWIHRNAPNDIVAYRIAKIQANDTQRSSGS